MKLRNITRVHSEHLHMYKMTLNTKNWSQDFIIDAQMECKSTSNDRDIIREIYASRRGKLFNDYEAIKPNARNLEEEDNTN